MTTTENIYDVGDAVKLSASIISDGLSYDPDDITLEIIEPDETETVILKASLTNESLGIWSYQFLISQEGRHYYRFTAFDPNGAESKSFYVKNTPFD